MSDAYSRAPRFSGRVVWTPAQGWTDDGGEQCGYICKRCGGPSPVGIGFVDGSAGAAERSAGLLACACGWSVTP